MRQTSTCSDSAMLAFDLVDYLTSGGHDSMVAAVADVIAVVVAAAENECK